MSAIGLTYAQLTERFKPAALLTFVQTLDAKADQTGYIYRDVAPIREVDDLRFELVKGALSRPVVAKIVDHLSAAPRAGRKGATVYSGVIPATKIARDIKPDDIKRLLFPRSTSEQERIIAAFYDDVTQNLKDIIAREEYNLIQVLSLGKIDLADPAGGAVGYVDYQVPATGSTSRFRTLPNELKFSNLGADLFQVIKDEADTFLSQTGVRAGVMLMTSTPITDMQKNTVVKKAIHGQANSDKLVTLNDLNQMLRGFDLPIIKRYDRVADIGTTAGQSMLATNKVIMLAGTSVVGNDGAITGSIEVMGTTDRGPTVEALQAQADGARYPWPASNLSGIFARVVLPDQQSEGVGAGSIMASATTIPNIGKADVVRILTVR